MEEGPTEAKVSQVHKSHNVALSLPKERRVRATFKEFLGSAEVSHLSLSSPAKLGALLTMFLNA